MAYLRAALIALLVFSATPAKADPISIAAFVQGIGAAFGVAAIPLTTAAGAAGLSVGLFLATPIGGLLLAGALAGGAAVIQALNRPQRTPPEASRVNVRIEAAPRWLRAGKLRAGGAVIFAEFDDDGAFWYLVAHADSELVSFSHYMLDELQVELNGSDKVLTKDFCLTTEGGSGSTLSNPTPSELVPYYTIKRTTFSPSDPTPPAISSFTSKFSEWTTAHKLAGVTYSVVKVDPVKQEDRHKIFRWRGPVSVGEPAISIVGYFSRIYDPREESHDIDDESTWTHTSNAALIWAWFRTHPYGMNKPMSAINWDKIADAADHCDVTITDKNGGTQPRYECGISIPDDMERHIAEKQILATCDGVLLFDNEGKAYIDVGVWQEPTLTFSAQRDIITMSSREAQDGESETDGVVIVYTEPDYGYIKQPCAPWINNDYYEEGRTPNFAEFQILGCHNHNQAVRLAKAIGKRLQPRHKLGPLLGPRALLARRKRIVALDYDDTFTGNYEISSPVELDESGKISSTGLVPIDQYRWTLLPGEEGDKPAPLIDTTQTNDLAAPSNLSLSAAPVPGSTGSSVRLEATFDAPPRLDHRYEFEYRKQGETAWRLFIVNMDERLGYTDTVEDGATYEIRYRTVSTAGGASEWVDPYPTVVATADTAAPDPVTGVVATPGTGEVQIDWTAPNSANYVGARIYRHTADDFGASTLVYTEYGAPSSADTYTDSGLAAGTYYFWVVSINGSGVEGTEVATGSQTVT